MLEDEPFYLAGPMRHRPFFNALAFAAAAESLRRKGYKIISPAEMDADLGINFINYPNGTEPLPEGHSLPDLMRRDLEAVTACQGVIVLPGWEHSTGAAVEVAYARFLSLPVFDIKEMLP